MVRVRLGVGFALLFALMGAAVAFMIAMPGQSYRGALPPLSAAEAACSQRLRADIAALSVTVGERRVGLGPSLRIAADLLDQRLQAIARVAEPGRARLRRERLVQSSAENLVLDLRGQRDGPMVLIGAHYDSAPGTPGANDNATGVAVALELAAHFAAHPTPSPLRFVLFANEEPPFFDSGAMGSDTHAAHARARGEAIALMLSLETLGYYSDAKNSQRYPWPLSLAYPDRGNFIGFVANLGSASELRDVVRAFRSHTQFPSEAAALPEVLPGVSWSDHASFWRRGYPAIMVTDTAPFRYPYYHTRNDELAHLDVLRLARVAMGLIHVIERLAAK